MATQTYKCPIHDEFDQAVDFSADVPKSLPCPADVPGPEPVDPLDAKSPPAMLQCGEDSPWVPPHVAALFRWSR